MAAVRERLWGAENDEIWWGSNVRKLREMERAMRLDRLRGAVEKNHAGGVSRDGGERVRTNRK